MRVAYLDCQSGISGDMTLGALVDAGVPLEAIQQAIDSLGIPHCHLQATEVKKHGFRATQVQVLHEPEHAHRHLHHIEAMIDGSSLTAAQQQLAKRIFQRLGAAEAKVHGTTIQKVHFHEVGAVDSIADIVGSAVGWDLLGVQRIYCAPVPTGTGKVKIAHGVVSVPAPATAELLVGVPLAACDVPAELTTPTGAALVATLVDQFGALPSMRIDSIGYGAGMRNLEDRPNLLRLLVGELHSDEAISSAPQGQVWVLETNLDDVPGEWIAYCTQRLLEAGALDVYTTAIQMKKNRPAVTLSVLCDGSAVERMEQIIFAETGSLGVRRWLTRRSILPRRPQAVSTPWGDVAGKVAVLAEGQEYFAPEYESCRALAASSGRPLREIYWAAQRAFEAEQGPRP